MGKRDLEDDAKRVRKEEKKARKMEEKKSKKREKKMQKLHETQSERRARKEKKQQAKVASFFGYTNEDNPFGDTSLHDQFVWRKKHEKEGTDELEKRAKEEKRRGLVDEIVKVRKRRKDREDEREEMERLKQEELRLREAAQYGDWQAKEESFHQKTMQEGSRIRITEGREKPIDVLAKNLLIFAAGADEHDTIKDSRKGTKLDPQLEMELREPYKIFKDLPLYEMKELQEDIQAYLEAEVDGPNQEFWDALMTICNEEVKKLQAEEKGGSSSHGAGMHGSIMEDVESMFAEKSHAVLVEMQEEIMLKIDTGAGEDTGVDVEYWESLMTHLVVYKAQAKLREIHTQLLMGRLQQLELRKKLAQEKREAKEAEATEATEATEETAATENNDGGLSPNLSPQLDGDGEDAGNMSPLLIGEGGEEEEVVDEEEDKKKLEEQRQLILAQRAEAGADDSKEAEEMFNREASKGMGDSEELLQDLVNVPDQVYMWHDKYRPRKPRYFNRVKTGYEWNKYNQTHYDHDNPPPKVVQGYKFNIFYPDLVDRSKTPSFVLEPADHQDFALIRFHGGPPYEDIAFKIVNKEWEYGQKRGFKCVFERGILQVYFNFKRHFYRR